MMHRSPLAALVALLAAASTAAAQDRDDVAYQQRFTYIGTSLTVEVVAPEAGELHVIRGEPGQLRVHGSTAGGFAGAGLVDSEEHLRITAVGTGHARFLVVVPEDVFVRIRIPGEPVAQSFGGERTDAVFTWGAAAETRARPLPPPPPPR